MKRITSWIIFLSFLRPEHDVGISSGFQQGLPAVFVPEFELKMLLQFVRAFP